MYVAKEVKDENGLVYAIQLENNPKAKTCVLHRNLLMPCGDFTISDADTSEPKCTPYMTRLNSLFYTSPNTQVHTPTEASQSLEEEEKE